MARKTQHLEQYELMYLNWYRGLAPQPGEAYDPTDLVALARQQWSDEPHLADALAQCTLIWPRTDLYHYFLPEHLHATRWHFAGTWFMQHPTLGALAFDMLHDKEVPGGFTVGGVEYLDRVMSHKVDVVEFLGGMLQARARFVAQQAQN